MRNPEATRASSGHGCFCCGETRGTKVIAHTRICPACTKSCDKACDEVGHSFELAADVVRVIWAEARAGITRRQALMS